MNEKLIIVYDFDGTLTPTSYPKYEIITKCGYNQDRLMELVKYYVEKESVSPYMGYFKAIDTMINESDIVGNMERLCLGADKIEYNIGIDEYFENLKEKNVKHYIVTSGYGEYIRKTKINQYISGVYGTEVHYENGNIIMDKGMSDVDKVLALDDIKIRENTDFSKMIYIGDGGTDKDAFEYIHKNGGTSIFVYTDDVKKEKWLSKNLDFIDYYFLADYSKNSELSNYINSRLEN